MSTVILLRGNSGSGKSTVAKLLQRKLGRGTLLIPQDVIRRELLWVNDRPGNPAVPLMSQMAVWGAQNCEYVIIEGI
ncbi:MAG: kinase, partial [Tidjanibacter sp.]|nr:kinase [Tidjanibacter sp.]